MPQTKETAQTQVDRHVTPRDCFIWYVNNAVGFQPLPGTGCAHYVAHQQRIRNGTVRCDAGFTIRVPDLVAGLAALDMGDVRPGDIWTNGHHDHCGIVVEVTSSGSRPRIVIEHCSSHQGGVVRNDWSTHFSGQGLFYRSVSSARSRDTSSTRLALSGFPAREAFG